MRFVGQIVHVKIDIGAASIWIFGPQTSVDAVLDFIRGFLDESVPYLNVIVLGKVIDVTGWDGIENIDLALRELYCELCIGHPDFEFVDHPTYFKCEADAGW